VLRELDLVALDQGIREQLFAHPLDGGACCSFVRLLDVQVDDAADPGLADGEAELP
jgi:hypothetical protein